MNIDQYLWTTTWFLSFLFIYIIIFFLVFSFKKKINYSIKKNSVNVFKFGHICCINTPSLKQMCWKMSVTLKKIRLKYVLLSAIFCVTNIYFFLIFEDILNDQSSVHKRDLFLSLVFPRIISFLCKTQCILSVATYWVIKNTKKSPDIVRHGM